MPNNSASCADRCRHDLAARPVCALFFVQLPQLGKELYQRQAAIGGLRLNLTSQLWAQREADDLTGAFFRIFVHAIYFVDMSTLVQGGKFTLTPCHDYAAPATPHPSPKNDPSGHPPDRGARMRVSAPAPKNDPLNLGHTHQTSSVFNPGRCLAVTPGPPTAHVRNLSLEF